MCEILMLIFGIITLIRGRFVVFRTKEVLGWQARIVGAIMVLPVPLSLFVGLVIGTLSVALGGKGVDEGNFMLVAIIAEFVIVAACFCLAIGIAMYYAQPIRKKKPELAIPEDYDERFHTRDWETPKSEGITGGPAPPPTSPDDRIQL